MATSFTPPSLDSDQSGSFTPPPLSSHQGPASDTVLDKMGHAMSEWWGEVNPWQNIKGMAQAAAHPIDTGHAMLQAQGALYDKASNAFQQGNYVEGARHALNYLIPVLGPALDKRGDQAQSGDVAGSVGGTLGIATNLVAPELLKKLPIPSFKVAGPLANPNPVEASAVSAVRDAGVDVDLATASGNKAVAGIQQAVETSPLGAPVALRARLKATGQQAQALENVANQVHPGPVTAEQAGRGVTDALNENIQQLADVSGKGYDQAWSYENDPANVHQVPTGNMIRQPGPTLLDAQGNPMPGKMVPETKGVSLPVDMRDVKAQVRPLRDQMQTWLEPAARNASPAYQAMDSILKGDDFIPASQAEQGLSGLKTQARIDNPNLRDINQGVAAGAASKLEQGINDAMAQAGPDALQSLQTGRAAHATKMQVAGIANQLRTEPVQAFNQAIYANDAGVDFLRKIQQQTPEQMPLIGRAYLDQLLGKATAQGGFDQTGGLWKSWQSLGDETKKILFPSGSQTEALDNLFLVSKKMAERPNPSGSGTVGALIAGTGYAVTNPMKGAALLISGPILAKMMYSPAAVKALTEGMQVSLANPAAALATRMRIMSVAKQLGANLTEIPAAPAAADANSPASQTVPAATLLAPQ